MFDRDSRYANVPLKQTLDAEGRTVAYVARRIIPQVAPVAETTVQPGDRLDLVANRVYGDPRLNWRIRDANPDPTMDVLPDLPMPRPDRSAPVYAADPAEPTPPYAVGTRLKLTQIEPE